MMEALGVPYPPPSQAIGFGRVDPLGGLRDGLSLRGTVERVSSGDSMTVRSGTQRLHVRLLGLDAPELHYQRQCQHPWAELARRRLQTLAPPGAAVRLITDRQVFDQYGRLLAYVYRGQRNLNLELLRSGWAVTHQIYPNLLFLNQMASATAEARAAGRGIFDPRRPLPLLPYEFRHEVDHQPRLTVCGDRRTRRYVPPAEYQRVAVAQRVFFQTETDARAFGYLPAEPGIPTFTESTEEYTANVTPAMMARMKLRAWREAGHALPT